jgi:hypothetical protein
MIFAKEIDSINIEIIPFNIQDLKTYCRHSHRALCITVTGRLATDIKMIATMYMAHIRIVGIIIILKIVAGGQYEQYRSTSLDIEQTDLSNDDINSFAVATGTITLSQSISAYKTLGFFARLNYDWKGRYIFEASARADGSSRFAPDSRWGFFPISISSLAIV